MPHALVVDEHVPLLEHDPVRVVPLHCVVQRSAAAIVAGLDLHTAHPAAHYSDEINLDARIVAAEVHQFATLDCERLGHGILRDGPHVHERISEEDILENGSVVARDEQAGVDHVQLELVDLLPLLQRTRRLRDAVARQCDSRHGQPVQCRCEVSESRFTTALAQLLGTGVRFLNRLIGV